MGEFKTPAGVVIRTSDVAARSVGFSPVEKPKSKPTPRRRKGDDEAAGEEK